MATLYFKINQHHDMDYFTLTSNPFDRAFLVYLICHIDVTAPGVWGWGGIDGCGGGGGGGISGVKRKGGCGERGNGEMFCVTADLIQLPNFIPFYQCISLASVEEWRTHLTTNDINLYI